jgi:phage shock protein C
MGLPVEHLDTDVVRSRIQMILQTSANRFALMRGWARDRPWYRLSSDSTSPSPSERCPATCLHQPLDSLHVGMAPASIWSGILLESTPRGVAGMVSLGSPACIAKGGAMADSRKLYRSRTNRQLAGVCDGLDQYLTVDATLIRVLFVLLAVLGGSGLVLHVALWIIVPNQP